jgi:hypothetical protein
VKQLRGEWVVLGVAMAAAVALSALLGAWAGEGPESRPNPSTYNHRGSGSLGLYLWLRELGIPVHRWERPLRELAGRPDARVLLMLGPFVRPPDEDEIAGLMGWVRQGGTLLLADDTPSFAVPGMVLGPPALHLGLRAVPARPSGPVRPALPTPYLDGVQELRPKGAVRFERRSEGWVPLFADAHGDVVALRRLGRGTVVAVADPGVFSNAGLETPDHARLVLNLIHAHAGRGEVMVDEYHHGHGAGHGLVAYLRRTSLPWILAQAALLFLAFVFARGTRFGPPVPLAGATRASSLEYVSALADLYRRAGARALAAEALAGSVRRLVAERLGLGAQPEPSRLGARHAERLGVPAAALRAALVPGRDVATSDEALLGFARAVHHLELRLQPRPGRAGRIKEEA